MVWTIAFSMKYILAWNGQSSPFNSVGLVIQCFIAVFVAESTEQDALYAKAELLATP